MWGLTGVCRDIGSELVQKYVGEARMVRKLFDMARIKKACLIFEDIDAVGGSWLLIFVRLLRVLQRSLVVAL